MPSRTTVAPGDTVTLGIEVGNGGASVQNLFGLSFELTLDAATFSVLDASAGDFILQNLSADELVVLDDQLNQQPIPYSISRVRPQSGVSGHGTVAAFEVKVSDDASIGDYEFGLQEVTANDPDGSNISLTPGTRSLTIEKAATNRSPTATGSINDQELQNTYDTLEVDLSGYFSDPDGDALTYSASVTNSAIVDASTDGSTLTVLPTNLGSSMVTVTAEDGSGASAQNPFQVTVTRGPDLVLDYSTHPDPAPRDGEYAYAFTIGGGGSELASGVGLTVDLPTSVSFVTSNLSRGSCTFDSGSQRLTCDVGDLGVQDEVLLEVDVEAPDQLGPISGSASLSLDGYDADDSDNSVSIDTDVEEEADADGVTDTEESQVPGRDGSQTGDGNGDGTPDDEQENVTSLKNSESQEYITIEAEPGQKLEKVKSRKNPSPDTTPEGAEFPVGFLEFEMDASQGVSNTVTVYLPPNQEAETYWQYGKTPDNPTKHWYEFLYDGETGAEIMNDENKIVLHFVDGKRGDSDLQVNGRIVDPGAPALTSTNQAPSAVDDTPTVNEDNVGSFDVLANDSDSNGDDLTLSITSMPTNGTASIDDNGTPGDPTDDRIEYTPDQDYFGSDTFDYEVDDGNGKTDEASVTITIDPVNDAPMFTSNPVTSATEGSSYSYSVATSDVDSNDSWAIAGKTIPGWLTVTDNGDGTAEVRGTPSSSGDYSVVLEVDDGTVTTEQSYTLSVATSGGGGSPGGQNSAPSAADDSYTTDEDNAVTADVLANDSDADGDALSISIVSNPGNGSASVTSGGTPSIEYTPDENFSGSDSFTYEVDDGNGGTAQATVSLTVNAVNDPPFFTSNPATQVEEDETYSYDVAVSDVEGDNLTITAAETPDWMSFTDNGDGTAALNGTPPEPGDYEVTLEGSDGSATAEQSFTVTVAAEVNQSPTAAADTYTLDEDSSLEMEVLANDSDPDSDELTVSIVEEPEHGTVSVQDGVVIYTPDENYNGDDSYGYEIDDGNGGSSAAEVSITVTPINDPPGSVAIDSPGDDTSITVKEDSDEQVPVHWSAASDPEGDEITYTWQLALDDGFSNPVRSIEVGSSTEASIAKSELAGILSDQGVESGESIQMYHRVIAADGDSSSVGQSASLSIVYGTSTALSGSEVPETFELAPAYPNPFNPTTRIEYALPERAEVRLTVYSALGTEVAVLVNEVKPAGRYGADFVAEDLSSGLYIYRLEAGSHVETRKVMLIK